MWGASDFLFSSSVLHGCVFHGGKLSLACVSITSCVQAVGSEDAPQDGDRHPHSLLQAAFQVGFALPQLSRQRTDRLASYAKGTTEAGQVLTDSAAGPRDSAGGMLTWPQMKLPRVPSPAL